MDPLHAGLLRIYGLKSLDEATRETWPWWITTGPTYTEEERSAVDVGCFRMPTGPSVEKVSGPDLESGDDVLTIVERLRTCLYKGHWNDHEYAIYDPHSTAWIAGKPTLTEAVLDALRFIGEERG